MTDCPSLVDYRAVKMARKVSAAVGSVPDSEWPRLLKAAQAIVNAHNARMAEEGK